MEGLKDFDKVAANYPGSSYKNYGGFIEFNLHLNWPENGKFKINGTVEKTKQQLKFVLDRFATKNT